MPGVSSRFSLPCCPSGKSDELFFPFREIRGEKWGMGLGASPRFAIVFYGSAKKIEVKLSLYIGNNFKEMDY